MELIIFLCIVALIISWCALITIIEGVMKYKLEMQRIKYGEKE